jgi:O-antigen/teichoic acid export membrane protein
MYQLIRFTTFLVISILFTKSHLTRYDIGLFEAFMFIAGFVSFFWVTGVIQSFLSLVHNNKTFLRKSSMNGEKSPEIFNVFILLTGFSLLVFLIGFGIRDSFRVFDVSGRGPYFSLLLAYILLSNPSVLIEYIYLVRNQSTRIMGYGLLTHGIQLFIVTFPVLKGYDIIWALYAMVAISAVRFIWLLVLIYKYAQWNISWTFIKEHMSLGLPLIISALLSGSAQYIDGLVVTSRLNADYFAIFRYGAKELPLTLILATGLSNAMISEIGKVGNLKNSMDTIRHQSRRLIHFLFPISMFIMLFARWLYPVMFNQDFLRSADVFMMYLLLIIPRLVFPQTILIGLKKTRVIMFASFMEIILNVILSIILIQYYGTVGVALATAIVYILEKAYLIGYNYYVLKIRPRNYIPVKTYLVYTFLIILEFVLIDHRVINIY